MTAARTLDVYCTCRHHAQLHTPTGRLADTLDRGHGACTVPRCPCERMSAK